MIKYVAVYGSLKKGRGNHDYFLGEAKYHKEDIVCGFDMYSLGSFPGIKDGKGKILVELYSDFNLEALDSLEGEGSLYERRVVTTVTGVECYIYVYLHDISNDYKVECGVW